MKIIDAKLSDVSQAKKADQSRKSGRSKSVDGAPGKTAVRTDRVQVSNARQHMEVFRSALDAIPEVRVERVEQLRAEIASGQYEPPDAEEVAEKMISEALFLNGKFGVS